MTISNATRTTELVTMREIIKTYWVADQPLSVLRGIDLSIQTGSCTAIMGTSGSGKTTLMNILGCLDRPTSGSYTLNGKHLSNLSSNNLAHIRNRQIGFVFQQFNLLPRLTALENVMLPIAYAGLPQSQQRELAMQILTKVGLANRLNNLPSQLSGGQQQRVAIARALANQPSLILADEPTGALDTKTAQEIMELLLELNRSQSITIVLVTHEPRIAEQTHHIIHLQDGLVINQSRRPGLPSNS